MLFGAIAFVVIVGYFLMWAVDKHCDRKRVEFFKRRRYQLDKHYWHRLKAAKAAKVRHHLFVVQ